MEIFGFIGIGKHLKLDKEVIRLFFSIVMAILSIILRFFILNYHFFCNILLLILVVGCLQALEP